MNIGFDGSRAFVKGRTGTENYSYQLLLNLAKIDQVNTYFVYIRDSVGVNLKDWPSNFHFKVIKLSRLWTQAGLATQTFIDTLDILFIPSHTLPLIRKPGLKTVMTVHDLGAEYLPQLHQLKQRVYLNWMTHHQLKGANKLIAVSQATKENMISKVGVDSKKIEVIYEGVNFDIFKRVKGDVLVSVLNKFDLEKGDYFLFVGTIQPRKNLERLIEAFAEFLGKDSSNIKLVLAGGKGWLSDEIFEAPKKYGVDRKVRFLGRVTDEELASLYSGAKALVYPSLFEGFGLPILEAQACECPVITSKISSMPEVAGEAAILVDPDNTSEIAKAMEKITNNQETRNKLIKKGLENVRQFSWERCARETLELFQELR